MSKPFRVLIGFLFFFLGFLSLILKACGMQFIFMSFVQNALEEWSTLVYVLLFLGGFMMIAISTSKTRIPEEFKQQ